MSALTLDGIPLPVLDIEPTQRPAYQSVSRSGRVRRYSVGARRETLHASLGPLSRLEAAWMLARMQDADCWRFTSDEWSDSGVPSGLLIAAAPNPLGSHAAYLASSTPVPGGQPLSCSYLWSADGVAWTEHVQGEVNHGAQRIAGGTMAAGYYAGLSVVPAVLPAAWVPLLADHLEAGKASGAWVELAGDVVEPGLYEAEVLRATTAVNESVTIEVTFHPR